MKIDVDCPSCGKRYEVDELLAGKKSRCKECATVFTIPLGLSARREWEAAGGSVSAPIGKDASRSLRDQASPALKVDSAHAQAPVTQSDVATGKIVLNCPRCFKRYELDVAFAGKKSRCKDCKEVFTIPAPQVRSPEKPAPVEKKSSLGLRNFAIIPEEVRPPVFDAKEADLEPAGVKRALPPPIRDEEELEFAPRRIGYAKPSGRSSRGETVDTEIGFTLAGAYVALGILAFIILAIWHAAGEPGGNRFARVYGVSFIIFYGLGALMGMLASIWLLVIAFRDKLLNGVLCLVVPCFSFLYMLSRWRETRGIFAMCFAPVLVVVPFGLLGGLLFGVKGFGTDFGDRLNALVPDVAPRVNSSRLAEAERLYRDYMQAMTRYTDELSRIQSVGPGQLNRAALDMTARDMDSTELRCKSFRLTSNEVSALKASIGAEIRAAMIALKYQLVRLGSLPALSGRFNEVIARLDRSLAEWEAPAGGDSAPQLADQHAPPGLTPSPAPPPGMRPGAMPPPGMPGRFESFDTLYERLRSQYGERAIMVVITGLPTNSDPASGVTKRDVEDAIDKRLGVLVPQVTRLSTGSGDRKSICLAPVGDIKGLAEAIDFGKVSWKAGRIDVVASPSYIASVPRLPAAAPVVAARPPEPREKEPEIPADADAVTKSLLQLKSADMFKRKDALNRLTRTRPNDRLKDVHAAILPLLEDDDEDLVKHVVRALAVWQSPAALARLVDMAGDNRVFLRWDVIKSLGKYDEPEAARALVGRLKDDAHLAEEALKTMGPVAELPLIELLKNPDPDMRKKACEVLKFTGGAATLKAMSSMRPDPEFFVRVAAQDAFKMIKLRVGDSASDTSETKKAAEPPPARNRKKS